MKLEILLPPDPQYTTRAYAIIIAVEFDIELSPKGIWYFGSSKKATASWSRHGKGHTSSMKLYQEEHIN